LPRWVDLPTERPLEINTNICQALLDYCCATAQTLTLKKALITGSTSKVVMSKLAVDVWRKYETVQKAFKDHVEYKEMSSPFKSFLGLMVGLAKAIAYKYMGDNSHEEEKYGQAVTFLTVAQDSLKNVWVPSPGTPLAKFSKEIDEAKDDIGHIQRSYAMENNHIYFQKVVEENALEIPEGKCLMTPLGWVPPQPSYTSISA